MLVSREQDRWKPIDAAKVSGGRFHTRAAFWITPHVLSFLKCASADVLIDPFAGAGDILDAVAARGLSGTRRVGYDVAPDTPWIPNDSLISIPTRPGPSS